MTPQLNLAALTETELLALFGPQETSQRLPDITRARLEGRVLPGMDISGTFLTDLPATDQGRIAGATPEQSRTLTTRHSELLGAGATAHDLYLLSAGNYARMYTLHDTTILMQWDEQRRLGPTLQCLTWLRNQTTGLSCVITSNAPVAAAPAPSEAIDTHQHPDLPLTDLLEKHRQQVSRLGRAQKLPPAGAQAAWQAAYELNLTAWKRRGVLLETP